ncbi:MAG: 4Fe-4S binding protein [Rhodocyclaceae bacterium]|nr:4Fe-4S binding protein [Rhodocyclaceae bacterium]
MHTIVFHRQPPLRQRRLAVLARIGDWLATHRRVILGVQWVVVACYLLLVALPAFLPLPAGDAHLFGSALWHERVVLLAQYLFWGVWWPFVILSIMLMGRVWCGVLCPEGALSEWASRHGRGGAIPKWLRWGGWPFVAFVLTTVYGQLVSVYDYAQAALLILGGSTVAAMIVGYFYGQGKRVWCRYLCPVTGVFALLARLAPIHFRVDRAAWAAYPQRTPAVDCAPLLPVSHLNGMAQCHACGRCSGHRDAMTLAARSPNAEILAGDAPTHWDMALLCVGIFGVALGAFTWSLAPTFVALKQTTAAWLIERDILWPLAESPAWWLLTAYPQANDVFTLLDGAAILGWIAATALVLGGGIWLTLHGAARLAQVDARRLALGLVPLAGASLFLGLSMMTVNHLRAEGVLLPWLEVVRVGLLGGTALWSAALLWRLAADRLAGFLTALLPVVAVCSVWTLTLLK